MASLNPTYDYASYLWLSVHWLSYLSIILYPGFANAYPSFLSILPLSLLNNYNTKSQMALDITLRTTNKKQKGVSFLGTRV